MSWIDSADALWQWSGARSFTWPLDRDQLLRDLALAGSFSPRFAALDARGEMVGHVLLDVQLNHGLGNIGRVAVAPDRRGGGLGTALMRETVRHGFDELGLHRLQLTVYTFNTAAIACYRSVGFVAEGVARDATLGSTGYWDAITMSLLEPDHRRPPILGDGIRTAGPRDAERIAVLLTELGYPHAAGEAAERLRAWAAHPDGEVLVLDADGTAGGFVAVHRVPFVERAGARARIVALCVGSGQRRAGVGRRLMAAAERWAALRGAVEIELTSMRSRDEAQAFYRALGYEDRCERSARFTRALALRSEA